MIHVMRRRGKVLVQKVTQILHLTSETLNSIPYTLSTYHSRDAAEGVEGGAKGDTRDPTPYTHTLDPKSCNPHCKSNDLREAAEGADGGVEGVTRTLTTYTLSTLNPT